VTAADTPRAGVLLLGATGRTGGRVLTVLLERAIPLRAIVRSAKRLPAQADAGAAAGAQSPCVAYPSMICPPGKTASYSTHGSPSTSPYLFVSPAAR